MGAEKNSVEQVISEVETYIKETTALLDRNAALRKQWGVDGESLDKALAQLPQARRESLQAIAKQVADARVAKALASPVGTAAPAASKAGKARRAMI